VRPKVLVWHVACWGTSVVSRCVRLEVRQSRPTTVHSDINCSTHAGGRPFLSTRRRAPRLHLLLVGNGSLREELESRVEILAPATLKLAGFRQPRELASFCASADAFRLCSPQEPFGATLIEAATAGLPVVSTRGTSATADLVDDGPDARIIDSRTASECARVLAQLAVDSRARRRTRTASHERARMGACFAQAVAHSIHAALGAACPSNPPACAEAERS